MQPFQLFLSTFSDNLHSRGLWPLYRNADVLQSVISTFILFTVKTFLNEAVIIFPENVCLLTTNMNAHYSTSYVYRKSVFNPLKFSGNSIYHTFQYLITFNSAHRVYTWIPYDHPSNNNKRIFPWAETCCVFFEVGTKILNINNRSFEL
jgi:hypothetical protein